MQLIYSTVLTSFTCPPEEVYCKERRGQGRKWRVEMRRGENGEGGREEERE